MSQRIKETRILHRIVRMTSIALLAIALAGTAKASSFHGLDPDVVRHPGTPRVMSPGCQAFGHSYGEWGAKWYEWVMSFPPETNPIFDLTGTFNMQGQTQLPWFLAGTFGGGPVTRSVTIPAGRPVFFPLVCIANDYPCPDPTFQPAPGQSLLDFLRQGAIAIVDQVDILSASVDGVTIRNLNDYRGTSGLEYFTCAPEWAAFDPCVTGTPQPFVSDGYWVMLPPLPEGTHTLHFTGGVSGWGFLVDVTYSITVAGRHDVPLAQAGQTSPESVAAPVRKSWGQLKAIYR